MKPSGIEWIGDIPDDWEVRRLKGLGEQTIGLTYSPQDITDNSGTLVLRSSNIQNGKLVLDRDDNVYVSIDVENKILKDEDILICSRNGSRNLVGKTAFVITYGKKLSYGAFTTIFRSKYNKFLFYVFNAGVFEYHLASYNTSTINQLTTSMLNEIRVPFPPVKTQQKIADYLDEKFGEIDATIAKQKESIEKLKAYKQSLISETVTKGLDKSAPLKPSGIKWLGEIPQNARIIRLRFLSSIQTGDKDTVNRVENGKYPFYVRSPIVERIDTFSFDGEAILMAGDGVGAGKVFHYVNGKFDYHQRVYNIHNLKGVLGKFLYYYLRENFYKEIEQSNAKSTVDSIRLPMLLDFPIIVYPYDLQKEMVSFLDKKVAEIDAIIIKK